MFHVKHSSDIPSLSVSESDAALNSVDSQIEHLRELTNSAGISLTPHGFSLVTKYIRQIIICNRKVNLISHRDICRISSRHIFESLLLTKAVDFSGSKRILDVGTGAGLPGIPLKIWNPDLELTLLESHRKKVIFLDLAAGMLGFKNVRPVCIRAEDASTDSSLRFYFDVVVARSVAPLCLLLKLAEPFLKNDTRRKGICVFPKGSKFKEELKETDAKKWNISTVDLSHYLINKNFSKPLFVITALLSNT
ncbi:hypothetical protein AMJ80_08000 [bacterium SM23_31]|nr:MAG: hypothetical protein AMJ80_08000 [bacterium SM23_31]